MIVTAHPGEYGLWHVTGDAAATGTVFQMMRMSRWIAYILFVTRKARVVGILAGVTVSAAGCVAVDAVELAGLDARTHPPKGIGIVLSQVAGVGIEVGIFQSH